jgi:phenylpyruvate tautomerase PptA (4-oxalocrotonate tautomerase family)
MVAGISEAIAEAYNGLANTEGTLILHNEYPLENAGWAGRLQSDNPELVEAMKTLNERDPLTTPVTKA